MKNYLWVIGLIILISLIGIINAEESAALNGTEWKPSERVTVTWGSNVEPPSSIGDLNSFKVKGSGALSMTYKGDSRTYGNLDGGKRNEFIFDKSGNLKEAYFTPSQDGKYKLGNKEFFVPSGSDVVYKDGVVSIKNYNRDKIEKPTAISSISDADEDVTLSFESSKGFTLDNGDKFLGTLKYRDGFFFEGDAKIGSVNVKNPENVPTYLFYDGEVKNVNAAYISINKEKGKLTVGCNLDVRGPAIKLDEGNPFGVKIENGDYFAMRPLGNSQGSYISIQNRDKENKVPYVETLNQFVMDQDGKSVYFNSDDGKLYLKTNGNLVAEFQNPGGNTGSTPLEVHPFKTINGIKTDISQYKNILGIGNQNNFGYGPDPKFIRTHVPDYYKKKKAPGLFSGFSNSLTYNYDHTISGLRKFVGIPIDDSTGVTKDPKNIQMLMDIFAGIPTENIKKWGVKRFEIVGGAWWAGLASSSGTFWIAVNSGGFSPGVIRHELTHLHDFTYSYNSKFNQEWRAIGGDRGPHTYGYGYTGGEDTSTFAEYIYRTDPWKEWLSSNYKYNAKFRARLAIFTKYNFVSKSEALRLLQVAGLPADVSPGTLEKYIQAGKDAFKTLGLVIIFGGKY